MPRGGNLGHAAARRVISAAAGWRAAHDADVLVLAIDGHGAAGKSTIAAAVAEATRAALVHTDDFFDPGPEPGGPHRSRLGVPAGGSPPIEQALSGYYDWRRLRAQALEPLRAGRGAAFRRFDWERGSGLNGTVTVAPSALILLEGVFSAAPELSDLVDRAVFVDTRSRERLRRLRALVTPEEWDDDWLIAEQAYFDVIRPPSSFDLIVPGTSALAGGRAVRTLRKMTWLSRNSVTRLRTRI
jgi:uridine kinase